MLGCEMGARWEVGAWQHWQGLGVLAHPGPSRSGQAWCMGAIWSGCPRFSPPVAPSPGQQGMTVEDGQLSSPAEPHV